MDGAEKMLADGSFGEREEQGFVDGIGRALRGGIEFADGIGFVAEEFDAQRTVGFRGVDIEDAAAYGVLAGHFDDVGGVVADGVEMREQRFEVEGFAATDGAGEIGVVIGGAEPDGGGGDWGDDDSGGAGGNFPERGGAFFLKFGVRGEILERENVAGGKGDDGVGITGGGEFAEAAEDGNEVFDGAIVIDDEDYGSLGGALKEHEQQGFGGGGETGDTNAPRALLEVGGNTREGGKRFDVREEFADEGKKHAGIF